MLEKFIFHLKSMTKKQNRETNLSTYSRLCYVTYYHIHHLLKFKNKSPLISDYNHVYHTYR